MYNIYNACRRACQQQRAWPRGQVVPKNAKLLVSRGLSSVHRFVRRIGSGSPVNDELSTAMSSDAQRMRTSAGTLSPYLSTGRQDVAAIH